MYIYMYKYIYIYIVYIYIFYIYWRKTSYVTTLKCLEKFLWYYYHKCYNKDQALIQIK